MRLSYWENTFKRNADRVYVQGLPNLPNSTKIWASQDGIRGQLFQASGDLGPVLKDISAVRIIVAEHLMASGDIKSVLDLDFNLLAKIAKRQVDKPVEVRTAVSGGSRAPEALNLDIRTIKVPDKVTIRVDAREPAELVDLLRQAQNVDVIVESLPIGDFILNDTVIVERKCCTNTPTDFENSIINDDKRLFYQSEKLKFEEDKIAIIMLEGDVYSNSLRMLVQQIDGALSFLAVIQKLSILQTYNLNHTAYVLVKLATHHRSGLGYELGLRSKKPKTLLSQQSFVLEGLPGVNAEMAGRLLEAFGTVQAVCNAGYADLLKVPGIGPKRAQQIVDVLGTA
jgi:ERCC4-type nuclease